MQCAFSFFLINLILREIKVGPSFNYREIKVDPSYWNLLQAIKMNQVVCEIESCWVRIEKIVYDKLKLSFKSI